MPKIDNPLRGVIIVRHVIVIICDSGGTIMNFSIK